jgi:hypothetical protein
MTVNFETPRIAYVGNGTTTSFSFEWSSGDPNENYVTLNEVLLTEGIEYELEDYTEQNGGRMVFYVAPASGDDVVVYRQTPITQQLNYWQDDVFPGALPFRMDTHEFQLDKDTRILQELRVRAGEFGTSVDLGTIQLATQVQITNTAGSDAFIDTWTSDGLLAGVAVAEVVEAGGVIPADGDPTAKPDGYIWYELEALP